MKDCSFNSENELVANGLKVIRIMLRDQENVNRVSFTYKNLLNDCIACLEYNKSN